MAWCLLSLSLHSEIQRKLRSELLAVSTENPDINDLNALPYLDAVLRESMRLHPAIPYTMRTANKDDVVPLAQPYTDKYGKVHDEFRCVLLSLSEKHHLSDCHTVTAVIVLARAIVS